MNHNLVESAFHPKIAPPFRLQFEIVQDAWVLLYPEGMVKLNPSAGEILKRCDGRKTPEIIVAEIATVFGEENVRNDVLAFLTYAKEQRWIL